MLWYAEIKHSDWLKIVTALGRAKQSPLFQHSISTLLKNLFMPASPGVIYAANEKY